MAYRSNGPGFDFDAHPLSAGQFYSELFPTGKVMVGWGRSGRSKWVQLDQAEIVNFLQHAAEMVRTDDPVLTGLLEGVAERIKDNRGSDLTIEDLKAGAQANDPEMFGHIKRFTEFMLEGRSQADSLRALNAEIAERKVIAELDADTARTHP